MQQQLSPRESQVVHLIADGKTAKEIGAALSIAESTVNWHVANVMAKLNASSRAEVVAISLRSGLLGDGSAPDAPSAPAVARPADKRADDGPIGIGSLAARLARRIG